MTGGRIRPAQPADAAAVARVHVLGWQETYPGIVPDRVLWTMSIEERRRYWVGIMQDPATEQDVFVAEEGGDVVGFGVCGPEQVGLTEFAGEFHALYLLQAAHGRGLGRALMATMAARMLGRGWTAASVWVLRDNWPARRFYEKLGGRWVAQRPLYFDGTPVMEFGYGWTDIARMAEGAGPSAAGSNGEPP